MATFEIYEESAEERAKKALASHEVVNLYMNGFIIALGQADIAIVMQTNGKIPAVVNMSFTLAKTLVDKLGNTIRDFEMKTGTTIMTTDTVKLKTQTGDGDEEIH